MEGLWNIWTEEGIGSKKNYQFATREEAEAFFASKRCPRIMTGEDGEELQVSGGVNPCALGAIRRYLEREVNLRGRDEALRRQRERDGEPSNDVQGLEFHEEIDVWAKCAHIDPFARCRRDHKNRRDREFADSSHKVSEEGFSDTEEEIKNHRVKGPYQEAWNLTCRVHPALWGVNRNDLILFQQEVKSTQERGGIPYDPEYPNPNHNNPGIGPSMHAVNSHVIIPTCRSRGKYRSWALMQHPEGLMCHRGSSGKGGLELTFISHDWNEGVYEFCQKVLADVHESDSFWICFLANPQGWESSDLSKLLTSLPWRSPFARALKYTDRFCIVPNRTESIYRRLWCCYELYLAVDFGLHGMVGYAGVDLMVGSTRFVCHADEAKKRRSSLY